MTPLYQIDSDDLHRLVLSETPIHIKVAIAERIRDEQEIVPRSEKHCCHEHVCPTYQYHEESLKRHAREKPCYDKSCKDDSRSNFGSCQAMRMENRIFDELIKYTHDSEIGIYDEDAEETEYMVCSDSLRGKIESMRGDTK